MPSKKQKVLVTGGAGFIGSHLTDKLLQEGYEVVVVDNLSQGKLENVNKKAEFVKIDITFAEFEDLVRKLKPRQIFHFAAQSAIAKSRKDPQEDVKVNLMAVQRLLDLALDAKTRKIIFASTAAVYKETKKIPIVEGAPKEPLSFYGVSKLCAEYLLQDYFKRFSLPYASLRFSNVYGERQDSSAEGGVVAIFASRIIENKKAVIYGDGAQTRDFLYVSDAVEACVESLSQKIVGELNISTGRETSVRQLYQAILKISKAKGSLEFQKLRHIEIKNSSLSPEKFKKMAAWKPKVDLKDGLTKTLNYFKAKNESSSNL